MQYNWITGSYIKSQLMTEESRTLSIPARKRSKIWKQTWSHIPSVRARLMWWSSEGNSQFTYGKVIRVFLPNLSSVTLEYTKSQNILQKNLSANHVDLKPIVMETIVWKVDFMFQLKIINLTLTSDHLFENLFIMHTSKWLLTNTNERGSSKLKQNTFIWNKFEQPTQSFAFFF